MRVVRAARQARARRAPVVQRARAALVVPVALVAARQARAALVVPVAQRARVAQRVAVVQQVRAAQQAAARKMLAPTQATRADSIADEWLATESLAA